MHTRIDFPIPQSVLIYRSLPLVGCPLERDRQRSIQGWFTFDRPERRITTTGLHVLVVRIVDTDPELVRLRDAYLDVAHGQLTRHLNRKGVELGTANTVRIQV